MRLVERERLLGSSVAQVVERGALPRVDLAVVLGQHDREAAVDEAAERAAGLELGQLAVIADQHELAADRGDRVDELGELPGRDHPGLVDDEHAALRQRGRAVVVDRAEQRGDARARDPRVQLELARGAARDRHPEDREAGGLPRLARGAERERLARPRLADHHAHPVTVEAQALDHRLLLPRQRRPRGHRLSDRRRARDARARAAGRRRLIDQPLLEREQLRGRVDELLARHRQHPPVAAAERLALLAGRAAARPRAARRGSDRPPPPALARRRRAGREPLAQRLHDVTARERRRPPRQARSGREPSNIRSHAAESRSADRTRPTAARGPRVRSRARPRASATPPPARRPSTSSRFACRVASAAASAARGPDVPRSSSAASISARRRLNARSTGFGTPASSAIPFRTRNHSSPSVRVSSARNTAW